jgi:hypothetical protein
MGILAATGIVFMPCDYLMFPLLSTVILVDLLETAIYIGVMNTAATILKLNAYGHRWHVMVDGKGIVFSWNTLAACKSYCRRHGLTATRN